MNKVLANLRKEVHSTDERISLCVDDLSSLEMDLMHKRIQIDDLKAYKAQLLEAIESLEAKA